MNTTSSGTQASRQLQDAVIVSAVRTPVGSFGGQFKDITATELGANAVRAALERAGIAGRKWMRSCSGASYRPASAKPRAPGRDGAGIPKEVPATTINMLCGSGLKAVAIAAQMIRAGDAEIVIAGGMENMTERPTSSRAVASARAWETATSLDSMVHDGLMDAFGDVHMGITAENVAEDYGITREQQDEFAARSQQKAEQAIADGVFKEEIVPVEVPQKKGDRGSWTPTSTRAPARPRRRWASSAQRSARRVGPSPPGTRPVSTTARRPSC